MLISSAIGLLKHLLSLAFLEVKRVFIIYHIYSMGGKIAMLLALRNPAWLNRSIIVDMSPVNQTKQTSLFKGYVDSMKKAGNPSPDKERGRKV